MITKIQTALLGLVFNLFPYGGKTHLFVLGESGGKLMKPALRLIETIRGSMTHLLPAESCQGKTVSVEEEDSTSHYLLPTAGTLRERHV